MRAVSAGGKQRDVGGMVALLVGYTEGSKVEVKRESSKERKRAETRGGGSPSFLP